MPTDDLKRDAETLGLQQVLDQFPGELAAARQSAAALRARLPADLDGDEEPAAVFRAGGGR